MQKLIQKIKDFLSLDKGIGWFILFLLTQIVASVPAMGIIYIQYFDSSIGMQAFIEKLATDYATDMSNWCLLIGGLLLLSIYITRKIIKKEPIMSTPIDNKMAAFSFLFGMAFNAIMISIGMILIVIFRFNGYEMSGTGQLLLNQEVGLFTILVTGIIAPIQEEIGFRQGLTRPIYKMGNALTAIAVSAVIFGFLHAGTFQIVMTTILGLFMGYIMLVTGNVLYPILIHVGMNLLSSVMVSQESHELLIILVGGVAFILMVILIYRNESLRDMLSIKTQIKRLLDEHDKEKAAQKTEDLKNKKKNDKSKFNKQPNVATQNKTKAHNQNKNHRKKKKKKR